MTLSTFLDKIYHIPHYNSTAFTINTDLARVIIGEIKLAIVCGFTDEFIEYKLSGISAYPNIAMIPICPILRYDRDCDSNIIISEVDPIRVMRYVPTEKMDKLLEFRLQHKKMLPNSDFTDVASYLGEKKSLIRSDLVEKIDQPIERIKIFFSLCLIRLRDLEEVKTCIEYIQSYQNTGGAISLVSLLNYKIECIADTNLLFLVKKYGPALLEIPSCKSVVLNMIGFCRKNIAHISSFQEIENILDVICKLNIAHENIALCQKLLLIPYNRHTICFVKIFESNSSLFIALIKAMPWESGLKDLLYSNFCLEAYNVIYHILMHKKCEAMFTAIARNCDIESLVAVANLTITRCGGGVEIQICDELKNAEFCKVVLTRLKEAGELSKIVDIKRYYLYTFEVDPDLAVICAIQQGDIEGFLAMDNGEDNPASLCSVGQYIFSEACVECTQLIHIICEAVSSQAFAEFMRLYGSNSEGDSEGDSEMSQCLSWDGPDEVIILGGSDLEDYV